MIPRTSSGALVISARAISHRTEGGFTRIDLLVAVVVMALLGAVLRPALGGGKEETSSARCLANLRQIWVGMMAYAADNDELLYNQYGEIPNNGQWTSNPRMTTLLPPNHGLAYWGVAYFSYAGSSREVFRCPSARTVDEWREDGLSYPSEFWLTSTYGASAYLTRSYEHTELEARRITSIVNPATFILTQDSGEQKMEGADDTLGLFPAKTKILSQWVGGLGASYYGGVQFEWEWYRHDRRCNTIWLSGHASKIPFNGLNVGIDYRYYTGDTPQLPLPGE